MQTLGQVLEFLEEYEGGGNGNGNGNGNGGGNGRGSGSGDGFGSGSGNGDGFGGGPLGRGCWSSTDRLPSVVPALASAQGTPLLARRSAK